MTVNDDINAKDIEAEARATFARYLRQRELIQAGEAEWDSLADFFVADAVYSDPAWGRTEGADEIAAFMRESMTGLGAWRFPEAWTMYDGRRVVSAFDQIIPGVDGTEYRQCGISVLYYAGDGKFCYQMDQMNMAHINEDIASSEWKPEGGFNFPPREPNRDYSLGNAAKYLD